MKLTSKYFDSIRVKPEDDRTRQTNESKCQWRGCEKPAKFPAPKGRDNEGEYYLFCQSHVREYNKKYNYFEGMESDDIIDYQKSASTGHRPTWSVGDDQGKKARQGSHDQKFDDPFHFFEEDDTDTNANGRRIRNLERKSLGQLGLPSKASKDEIKSRYKELVKRHHPDLNGGDRNSEDKLREVISAYNYLKKVGLV